MTRDLPTLDAHNAAVRAHYAETHKTRTLSGVACPKCHTQGVVTEMLLPNPDIVMLSIPPKKDVVCPECAHVATIIC